MTSIVSIPHEALSRPAEIVTSFDARLKTLIKTMKTALLSARNPKGVGLAAPQIGQSLRIFITKPDEHSDIRVFINPEILDARTTKPTAPDKDTETLEGCLSIPSVWGHVRRHDTVLLRYQDETGASHEETFTGFMATIVQHEVDHLEGVLFTQRIVEQNGTVYEQTKDKDGKAVLDEIRL